MTTQYIGLIMIIKAQMHRGKYKSELDIPCNGHCRSASKMKVIVPDDVVSYFH